MVRSDCLRAGSTAAICDRPIRPMLVCSGIGFLVGPLATDFAFWRTSDPFWARLWNGP